MKIIRFIITWFRFIFSKDKQRILKYQCRAMYDNGKWSYDQEYGWACQKRSNHFGQHEAHIDILDDDK